MAKLTQGATICHVYLSYKICYTWQVAGVGAGYIGKKNTTVGCVNRTKCHATICRTLRVLGAFGRSSPPPPVAWRLKLDA